MLLFPEPLEGLTVSQDAEVVMVHSPVALIVMNWLPASPSTVWVFTVSTGGTAGSTLTGSLQEKTAADSARSTVSTRNNLANIQLTVFG